MSCTDIKVASSAEEQCVAAHQKRETFQKLHMSHFITMIMVNVSHILCSLLIFFLEQLSLPEDLDFIC